MILKVSELKNRKGEELPFETKLDEVDLKNRHQEIRKLTPVEVQGGAVLLGGLVYVKGQMEADANFVCARCLTPFDQHLTIPFSETFAPEDSGVEIDEESDIHEFSGDEIELGPVLEEDFLLSVSPFPLCTDECKGLCPTCGTNYNEQQCSCTNERIDPRLAGLADFFKKIEE